MEHKNGKFGLLSAFRKALRKRKDERGSVTVEFVLWVPVFMVIIALTVDVSSMFLRQSNMWQVARDTVRQISLRQRRTESSAIDYAVAHATYSGDVPTVIVEINTEQEFARVEIRVPIRTVGVFGVLNIGGSNDLVATVTQRLEPN